MLEHWGDRRLATHVEFTLVCHVLFCLPLLEAPKNILGGALIAIFFGISVYEGNFGRKSLVEIPIWILIAVLWISPFTSEYQGAEAWYHGHLNLFESAQRWTLLGFVVLVCGRLVYSPRQIGIIWVVLCLGATVAVAEALIAWLPSGSTYPELRSVGHVNPSSLYVLVVIAAGLGAFASGSRVMMSIGCVALIAGIAYLIPSRSLVALLGFVAIAITFLIYMRHNILRATVLPMLLGALLIVSIASLVSPATQQFRAEIAFRLTSGEIFSQRDKILFTALEVWDRNPVFGTGFNSFDAATAPEVVRVEVEADGRDFEAEEDRYFFAIHGHNLWTNALIERGMVGVLAYIGLLVLFVQFFWRDVPRSPERSGMEDMTRLSAQLVVIGFIVGGLGNTTMQNEHGQAGMMLLMISLSFLRETKAPNPT